MKKRIKLTESVLHNIIRETIKETMEARDFSGFFDDMDAIIGGYYRPKDKEENTEGNDSLMDRCGDEITDLCDDLKRAALSGDSQKVRQCAEEIAKLSDEISDYLNQHYQAN